MNDLAIRALAALGKGDTSTLASILAELLETQSELGWYIMEAHKHPQGSDFAFLASDDGPYESQAAAQRVIDTGERSPVSENHFLAVRFLPKRQGYFEARQ